MKEGTVIKCIKCGKDLEICRENFYFYPSANRYKQPCIECHSARAKQEEKERNERVKARYHSDKDFKKKVLLYQKNNPNRNLRYLKYKRKALKNLTDYYVKQILKDTHGIRNADQNLIELKRLQIQLHRATHGST